MMTMANPSLEVQHSSRDFMAVLIIRAHAISSDIPVDYHFTTNFDQTSWPYKGIVPQSSSHGAPGTPHHISQRKPEGKPNPP